MARSLGLRMTPAQRFTKFSREISWTDTLSEPYWFSDPSLHAANTKIGGDTSWKTRIWRHMSGFFCASIFVSTKIESHFGSRQKWMKKPGFVSTINIYSKYRGDWTSPCSGDILCVMLLLSITTSLLPLLPLWTSLLTPPWVTIQGNHRQQVVMI